MPRSPGPFLCVHVVGCSSLGLYAPACRKAKQSQPASQPAPLPNNAAGAAHARQRFSARRTHADILDTPCIVSVRVWLCQRRPRHCLFRYVDACGCVCVFRVVGPDLPLPLLTFATEFDACLGWLAPQVVRPIHRRYSQTQNRGFVYFFSFARLLVLLRA